MKLIWTRELDAQNPWEPDFHGVFFYQESGISFYYKDEHLVRCVHGQMDEPEILFEGKRGDPRFEGLSKFAQYFTTSKGNIENYVGNIVAGFFTDFKFKN